MGNNSSSSASETRVSTLETQVGGLNGTVGLVSTRVNTLEGQFNTLATRATADESRLDTLEKAGTMTVSGVDYNVVYAQNSIKAFAPMISSLQATISTLELSSKSFSTLFGALEQSASSQGTRVTALETTVVSVQSQIGILTPVVGTTVALSTRLGSLETRFAPVELSITSFFPAVVSNIAYTFEKVASGVINLTSNLDQRVATLESLQGGGGAGNTIFTVDNTNKQVNLQLATKFCIGTTCITESDLKTFKVERGTFLSTVRVASAVTVPVVFTTSNGIVASNNSTDGGITFAQPGLYRITGTFTAFDGRGGDDDETYYAYLRYKNGSTLNVVTYLPSLSVHAAFAGGYSTKNATDPSVVIENVGGDISKRTVRCTFPSHHYNGGGPWYNKYQFTFDVDIATDTTYYFTFGSYGNRASVGLKDTDVQIQPIVMYSS